MNRNRIIIHPFSNIAVLLGIVLIILLLIGAGVFFIVRQVQVGLPPEPDVAAPGTTKSIAKVDDAVDFDDMEDFGDDDDKSEGDRDDDHAQNKRDVVDTDFPSRRVAEMIIKEEGLNLSVEELFKKTDGASEDPNDGSRHLELEKKIKEMVEEDADRVYSGKVLTKQIMETIKLYSVARPGQKVTFSLKNKGRGKAYTVTGKFQRKTNVFIYVDGKAYNHMDIDDSYKFLFDEGKCNAICKQKIDELKAQFDKRRVKYEKQCEKIVAPKVYKENGYIQGDDGSWRSPADHVMMLLERAKALYDYEQE